MDLEIVILSEESQTEMDKYCMIFLICGIQKNYTKEFINKTEIELQIYETILWLPRKRRGEINWETGIGIYTSPSDFQLLATLGPISIHIIRRSQHQPPAKCVSYPTHPTNLDQLSVPLLWNSQYFIFWLLKNKLSDFQVQLYLASHSPVSCIS